MKKTAVLCMILMGIVSLTACVGAGVKPTDTVGGAQTTIELELDRDYDDSDPFVNEKLFCVSQDLDALAAEGTLEMDCESAILEVKNNRTEEVLWSNTWKGTVESETFSIPLKDLKKGEEYVVSLTARKTNYAVIGITFNRDEVQEREKPLR